MRIELERSPMNEAWVDMYNQVQLEVARQNAPRVAVLDLNRALNPDGTWTDTVDGIKVRSFDRSHLSPEGADFVARWLVPLLPGVDADAPGHDELVVAAAPDRAASVSGSPSPPPVNR
jgi:hypothetical protein